VKSTAQSPSFSIEQITVVLQEAAQAFQGGDLCREIGISEQNLYRWKNVYCELQPIEERELKLAAHRSYEAEPPPDPDHSPITAVSTSTDNSARNSEERLRRSGTFIDTPLNDDQRRHLAGQILGRGLMGPSLAW
jgi:hypothetical protein